MSSSPERILFLPKWYPDMHDLQFGVFLQKHARAVSQYANVCVVYPTPDPEATEDYRVDFTEEFGFPEIRIYYKKSPKSAGVFQKIDNLQRFRKAMKKGLAIANEKQGKPDLIHVNILTRTGAFALWKKWTKGIPYVITEQWTGYGSGKFANKGGFSKWFSRLVGKNAAGILTVSNSLKGHMERNGFRNKFHIISNIIDAVKLDELPATDPNKIKFVNISDLDDEKKNVSAIIKVFHKLLQEYPNLELHIVGGGDDEEKLRQLGRDLGILDKELIMYGRRFNDFVYELVAQVNYLIVNSNFETFSVATAEGLINGKPVIVSRSGGPEEFVTPEVGIVIDKEADDQLEAAMRQLIENPNQFDPKVLADYAHNKFSYEKVGQHFMEIYTTAV